MFGDDGPVDARRASTPVAIADGLERLLDRRGRMGAPLAAGRAFARGQSWDRSAEQVERELRDALRVRGG